MQLWAVTFSNVIPDPLCVSQFIFAQGLMIKERFHSSKPFQKLHIYIHTHSYTHGSLVFQCCLVHLYVFDWRLDDLRPMKVMRPDRFDNRIVFEVEMLGVLLFRTDSAALLVPQYLPEEQRPWENPSEGNYVKRRVNIRKSRAVKRVSLHAFRHRRKYLSLEPLQNPRFDHTQYSET